MPMTAIAPPPGQPAAAAPGLNRLQALVQSEKGRKDPRAVAQACQECEAMFISQLTKQLRQGMLSGELAGASKRTEQFWAIGEQEFSRHMAASGGLGLGRWLYRQLTKETMKTPAVKPPEARPEEMKTPAAEGQTPAPETAPALPGGGEAGRPVVTVEWLSV